eukprot:gene10626-19366_t
MVDTRLRIPLPRLFECFVEVIAPDEEKKTGPTIKRFHPAEFKEKDELLGQVPTFCFPCRTDSLGVQYFTFVLTDIDGKFRFGFCRYPAHAPSCICIISYAPWCEMFYAILNNISEAEIKGNHDLVTALLDALHVSPIPDVGSSFHVTASLKSDGSKVDYKFEVPDTTKLPTIPENRNLTDYFAVITPEVMVTAIVHGSVSLLYPMQWQHIFVPVLPPKLLDYCCAPMPFLLGVHSSMMEDVHRMPLDDVVILDADKNELSSPFNDMEIFPQEVSSKLLSRLKKLDRALDDYVASQFLRALVKVIGGYRDALRFKEQENGEGGKIVFDEESFLATRSSSIRPFLEQILHLQSFIQFIAGRLDLLNAGIEVGDIFEQEILADSGDTSKWKFQHQQWMNKMKKGGGALKKTVGVQYAFLKGKANDIELKSKVKSFYKGAKSGVKTSYKGAKSQLKEIKHQLKTKDAQAHSDTLPGLQVKRSESMPASKLANVSASPFRHSMYSTLPSHRIHRGPKDVGKSGSQLAVRQGITRSTSSDCISINRTDNMIEESEESSEEKLAKRESSSESNILDLIVLDETLPDATVEKKDATMLALTNPSFSDDPFFIIEDEEVKMEHKGESFFEHSKTSNTSWVTFDDAESISATKSDDRNLNSPIVELGYEDLIGQNACENFVIISPEKSEFDSNPLKLGQLPNNPATKEDKDSLLIQKDDLNSSLLTDTLCSMSVETRSLFTRPQAIDAVSHGAAYKDEALGSETIGPGTANIEKKKRRPPPRPPLPTARPGSIKGPSVTAFPPRNIPNPRPIPPRNIPKLTSSSYADLKRDAQRRATGSKQTCVDSDPFADLLNETRNGIAQSISKK